MLLIERKEAQPKKLGFFVEKTCKKFAFTQICVMFAL